MTAIGILGAAGRMGRAIAEAAREAGVTVVGGIDRRHGAGELAALAAASDVLIDFSVPDALAAHVDAAVAARTPILVGTTGLAGDHHATIDRAALSIALIQAANTSLGVTLLARLVREAASRLSEDWDIEIVEMHHRHKRDAPSGTALLLGASASAGRGAATGALDRLDRGTGGAREPGTIHYASLRGGSVPGDHQVIFATEGERVELGHRAESRGIFATGAIRAALWLAGGRPPGRYTMDDVLAA
ncbi:4-hydroxy-tetrahydrodipicolinate reductase [Sphingomonas sp.]|uniref:4-hydroxy-tetrahydrodipicolinate reductase n=1 Tax=Sphingomonas sp. TaxID=28214 RepID=UPI003AFF87D6